MLHNVREKIRLLASGENHYKYTLYTKFNPYLKKGDHDKHYSYLFSRLRLSSNSMPIELGRWQRIPRENRLCNTCGVIGDEFHYVYQCREINRTSFTDLPATLHGLSEYPKLASLLQELSSYLQHWNDLDPVTFFVVYVMYAFQCIMKINK